MPAEAARNPQDEQERTSEEHTMADLPPRPLHHVTPTERYIRIAAALIKRDYRRNPTRYSAYPANGIEALARDLRGAGFAVLTPWLQAAARHVAGGLPLREWEKSMPWDWNRAVFKQRWRRSR